MPKISVVKGDDRKENIRRAVKLVEADIEGAVKTKKSKQLFIKINAIDTNFHLACTHIEALESVLSVFYDKFDEIIVGDNTFVFCKEKGGPYRRILSKFPEVRLSDLTEFESEEIEFERLGGRKSAGEVSLISKKAFTLSLALPKTHDAFVYTGCLKNMFGCVIRNRGDLHALSLYERLFLDRQVRSNRIKWQNLVKVIYKTKPDLCILDAYEGMEGDGPLFGDKVHLGVAMCSLDGYALDKLASKICGISHVPYLSLIPDSPDVEIIKEGFEEISEITKEFKPHYNNKYQIKIDTNSSLPQLDVRFVISVLRRAYRIRDKLVDKFKIAKRKL